MEEMIPRSWKTIFQIGELDFSPNEFALAPSQAREFKDKFPQDPVFIVGKSLPSDFPFIHPNEADTFWAKEPHHKFTIVFNLSEEPKGKPLLFLALADVHESLAPVVEIQLNDKPQGEKRVRAGKGRAFYGEKGEEQLLAFILNKDDLKLGENKLEISLTSGSWIAYDAIFLFDVPQIPLSPPEKPSFPLTLFGILPTSEFESKGIVLEQGELSHYLLFPGDFLQTSFAIDNSDFEMAGQIYLLNGNLKISYTLPEEAMGENWSFNLPEINNQWLTFLIRNLRDKVSLKILDPAGKVLLEREAPHLLSPSGRLKLSSEGKCEFYLANLFYRPPINLELDKVSCKKGDVARLRITASPIGYLDMEIKLISHDGRELDRRKRTISPYKREWEEDFLIDENMGDGDYVLNCEILHDDRTLWEGNLTLYIKDEMAKRVIREIQRLEKEKKCYASQIQRALRLFASGDFPSALSMLEFLGKGESETTQYSTLNGDIILRNEYFEMRIRTKNGFGPYLLIDRKNGRILSDAPYIYFINEEIARPEFKDFKQEGDRFILIGESNGVEIVQEFYFPRGKPYFEERITVNNRGKESLKTPNIAFGFSKNLRLSNGKLLEGLSEARVVAIPYRRPLQGRMGEYEDYPFEEILWRKGWYRPIWNEPKVYTEEWGAEGWALVFGDSSLMIAKHNNDGMEYSTLKLIKDNGEFRLRFGGGGVWHGDPEYACELSPGEEFRFGITRYSLVEGDWKACYYAFREFMEENGHKVPENYNPPIHWNELYDNPLWWGPDTEENRKKYYSLPQILEEAEKAREIGCEALYLDPGWDTSFASSIWAEDRLLKAEEFMKLMKEKYGLYVSLHTPLAGWSDINAYPIECRRKDENGNILPALCGGSEKYIETKANRLKELAKAGVVFFMFDGSAYTGECYDISHNHPIPYTREAHCRAILKLAQLIHKEYPNVLIELHDPIIAGVPERYAPTYYLHALPGSFDEVWAFEYMWSPLEDLLSGRAISLYYYNLAYSLPLYIHIDLRKDNENCLEFWWYASTCRHLGVGGKHPDERIWEAHKKAMSEYKRLKEYFTRGTFYGIDETVHIHSLKGKGAVINLFNLGDKKERKYIAFKLEDIGIDPDAEIRIKGANWRREGSQVIIWADLPPKGCSLVELEEVK